MAADNSHDLDSTNREIFNTSPTGVAIIERGSGKRIFVNSALVRMSAAENHEDTMSQRVSDTWVKTEDLQLILDEIQNNKSIENFEVELWRIDGSRWFSLLSVQPIVFEGKSAGLVWHVDVSDKKEAEEEIKIRGTWLEAIFENAPNEIVFKDTDGAIIGISRSVAASLQCKREDFIGRTTADFLPLEVAKKYMDADQAVIESGELVEQEVVEQSDSGNKYMHSAKFPVRDDDGLITGVCSITSDLTGVRRADEDRKAALVVAEEANRAKSDFLANMSHELRTPVNAIQGFAEIMTRQLFGHLGSSKYLEYAHDIHSSSEHLLSLINDLLDLSIIESGNLELKKEQQNVVGVVEAVWPIVSALAERKKIDLSENVFDGILSVHADRRALIQILINLLSNAIKFTQEGGRVSLSVTLADKYTSFEVSDNGKGIPKDLLQSLTRPFVRVQVDPNLSQEGTGLGLSIVKSLVNLHGGKLSINSEMGKGTKVSFSLPGIEAP